jgi:hypothetical protein
LATAASTSRALRQGADQSHLRQMGLLIRHVHQPFDAPAKRGCRIFESSKRGFNGDGLLALYLSNISTTKETTMPSTPVVASRSAPTFDPHKWISCSHWGLFQVPENSSKTRGGE